MKSRRRVERIVETEASIESVSNEDLLSMDDAVSLEELSQAYAKLITQQESTGAIATPDLTDTEGDSELLEDEEEEFESFEERAEDGCLITPSSILEAILFVSNSENRLSNAVELASMMRGVQAGDIPALVSELNAKYRRHGHVLEIVTIDDGYRMQLANDLDVFRNTVVAKVRESQLSQSAVDCLSVVAYRPGSTCDEIEQIWGRSASTVLSLLVRRELLRVDRQGHGKTAKSHYFPSERFLNLVGLETLDDLPRVDDDY